MSSLLVARQLECKHQIAEPEHGIDDTLAQ